MRPKVGDPALQHGEPREAHITRKDGITEAYVVGSPLTALCGKVFVPTRDPKNLPICPLCKEIADGMPGGKDHDWKADL